MEITVHFNGESLISSKVFYTDIKKNFLQQKLFHCSRMSGALVDFTAWQSRTMDRANTPMRSTSLPQPVARVISPHAKIINPFAVEGQLSPFRQRYRRSSSRARYDVASLEPTGLHPSSISRTSHPGVTNAEPNIISAIEARRRRNELDDDHFSLISKDECPTPTYISPHKQFGLFGDESNGMLFLDEHSDEEDFKKASCKGKIESKPVSIRNEGAETAAVVKPASTKKTLKPAAKKKVLPRKAAKKKSLPKKKRQTKVITLKVTNFRTAKGKGKKGKK